MMWLTCRRTAVWLTLCVMASAAARAETVQLTAVADAFIDSACGTCNYGSMTGLLVGKGAAGNSWHARIRFNLSSIPAGAIVDSATLRLHGVPGSGTFTLDTRMRPRTG